MEETQTTVEKVENYYILSFLINPVIEETAVHQIGLKFNGLSYVKVLKKPKGKFRKTFLQKVDGNERIVLYS